MATLVWGNQSQQPIKWLVLVNGQFQGNLLNPGGIYTMDDAGVAWAGWSESGFTGYTLTLMSPPPGYSGQFLATEPLSEQELAEKLRTLKQPG